MPVYEFLCQDCNRVFSFLARTAKAARRRPKCPKCGGRQMSKRFARFAMASRSSAPKREGPSDDAGGALGSGMGGEPELSPQQEARLEKELMGLARDMESIDESNPRQLGAIMRRLTDATGEPIDPAADEMIRRLEAGEDPDKIEETMGDVFPDEGGDPMHGGAPSYDRGLYDL